jgi:hypothetical protein
LKKLPHGIAYLFEVFAVLAEQVLSAPSFAVSAGKMALRLLIIGPAKPAERKAD